MSPVSQSGDDPDPTFHGHLMIFIEGYAINEFRCVDHNESHPNSIDYFVRGYAVGDNPTNRPCARSSYNKIKKFHDYDEAVALIDRRRRKNPRERYQLIYEVENLRRLVSSLDEILAVDADLDAHKAETKRIQKELRDRDLPGLDILEQTHDSRTALNAAMLLGIIRNKGMDAAKQSTGKSTFYRLVKILRTAGLVSE